MNGDLFPRGTRSVSSKKENVEGQKLERAQNKLKRNGFSSSKDDDTLFGSRKEKEVKRSKPSKQYNDAVKATPKYAEEIGSGMVVLQKNNESILWHLDLKACTKGSIFLGIVKKVEQNYATVALSYGISGKVEITEISDSLYSTLISAQEGDKGLNEHYSSALNPIRNDLKDIIHVGQVVRCVIMSVSKSTIKSGVTYLDLSMRASNVNRNVTIDQLGTGSLVWGAISSIEDHGYVVELGMDGIGAFMHKTDTTSTSTKLKVGAPMFWAIKEVRPAAQSLFLTNDCTTIRNAVTNFSSPAVYFYGLKPGLQISGIVSSHHENGVLISFLEFFCGGLEIDHMEFMPSENSKMWKNSYKIGTKVNARILMINYPTKTIRLTQKPHLMSLIGPKDLPPPSAIYRNAKIIRIEPFFGLVLKLPATEEHKESVAFVPIGSVDDKRMENLNSVFNIGDTVACRINGSFPIEGWAKASLKKTVLEASVVSFKDLSLGQVLPAKVVKIMPYGLKLELGENVSGMCLQNHVSDTVNTAAKPKIYKVGAAVKCKVLSLKMDECKVYLTMKKSLIHDTLSPLLSYKMASVGTVASGCITKISAEGINVQFYGDVHGTIPEYILKKQGVDDFEESFCIGQVVTVAVVKCIKPNSKPNLLLSLNIPGKLSYIADDSGNGQCKFKPGDICSGTIKASAMSMKRKITVQLDGILGYLSYSELSIHRDVGPALSRLFGIGSALNNLVVVSIKRGVPQLSFKGKDANDESHNESSSKVSTSTEPFLKLLLDEHFALAKKIELDTYQNRPVPNFSSFPIGSSRDATVIEVSDGGAVLIGDEDQASLVYAHSNNSIEEIPQVIMEENDRVKVRMLFYNAFHRQLDVSLFPEIVKEGRKKARKNQLNNLPEIGDLINVEVIQADKNSPFAVAMLENGAIGYITLADYHCPNKTVADSSLGNGTKIKVGLKLEATVCCMMPSAGPYSGAVLLNLHGLDKFEKESLELEQLNFSGLTVGSFTTGKVTGRSANSDILFIKLNTVGCSNKDDEIEDSQNEFDSDDEDAQIESEANICDVHWPAIEAGSEQACSLLADYEDFPSEGVLPPWHPFAQILKGDIANVRILSITDKKSMKKARLSLILPGSEPTEFSENSLTAKSVKMGEKYRAIITRINEKGCWVQFSSTLTGYAPFWQITSDSEGFSKLYKSYAIGMSVVAYIVSIRRGMKHADVSFIDPQKRIYPQSFEPTSIYVPGTLVLGRVIPSKIKRGDFGITVKLETTRVGIVNLSEIADRDQWTDTMISSLKENMIVECVVQSDNGKALDLSTRQSRLKYAKKAALSGAEDEKRKNFLDKALKEDVLPGIGENVTGIVSVLDEIAYRVILAKGIQGKVQLNNLPDESMENPHETFFRGKIVNARLLGKNFSHREWNLSLKPPDASYTELYPGLRVEGTVIRLTSFGLVIRLQNSRAEGFCHKYDVSVEKVENFCNLYSVGDLVKAVVLNVNAKQEKLNLGIKHLLLEEKAAPSHDKEQLLNNGNEKKRFKSDAAQKQSSKEKTSVDGNQADQSKDEPSERSLRVFGPPLVSVNLGFNFEDFSVPNKQIEDADESDDDNEVIDGTTYEKGTKHTTRKRAAEKMREEKNLRNREKALLDDEQVPETISDFERMLVASPNSSVLWLKYMAYHLSLADIGAARVIAERALKRVQFREEHERFNIWVGFLNLELKYGTREALSNVFERACVASHPKRIHLKLAEAHEKAGDFSEAEAILSRASHRFKTSKKVWMAYQQFFLARGDEAKARALLKRSLESLSKHKHVPVISRFAQEEYNIGYIEQGRAVFEGLISNFPRRLDLWNVFIDREIKSDEIEAARVLFKRLITLELKPHLMKSAFKKYLAFESKYGDIESVEDVKEKAKLYVQGLAQ